MYANYDAKIGYLAHPRTASTATCHALKLQAGFDPSHQHHATPPEAARKHPGIHDGIDWTDGWIVFATVRNHYTTFRSEFINTNYHPKDEPLITAEVADRLIETSLYWRYYNEAPFRNLFYHIPFCTTFVHYEHLEEQVNEILHSRGVSEVSIDPINVSKHNDLTCDDLFTDGGRKWVKCNYGVEMNRYGYQWNW